MIAKTLFGPQWSGFFSTDIFHLQYTLMHSHTSTNLLVNHGTQLGSNIESKLQN